MLENEADSANSQQELPPKPPGRKMSDNTSSGDGGEGDSRFVGPGVPRLPHPGNGTFPVGNLPLSAVGEAGVFGGQMISPTHPPEHVQYMQHQVRGFVVCSVSGSRRLIPSTYKNTFTFVFTLKL